MSAALSILEMSGCSCKWITVWLCVSLNHYITVPEMVTLYGLQKVSSLTTFISSTLTAHVSCSVVSMRPTLWGPMGWLMEFSKHKYRHGLSFPPPGNFPDQGSIPASPASAGRFFTSRVTWEDLRPTCNTLNNYSFQNVLIKYNFCLLFRLLEINFKAQLLRLTRRESIILHSNLNYFCLTSSNYWFMLSWELLHILDIYLTVRF